MTTRASDNGDAEQRDSSDVSQTTTSGSGENGRGDETVAQTRETTSQRDMDSSKRYEETRSSPSSPTGAAAQPGSPHGDDSTQETATRGQNRNESFSDIYQSIRSKPVIVTDVIIANNKKTRTWLLKREVESIRKCSSFETVKDGIFSASEGLMLLDIFKSVDVLCDLDERYSRDPILSHNDATPVVVTFNVSEKSDLMFNGGTYIQSGEGLLELTAQLKNRLLGLAETLEANVSMGAKSSTVYSVSLDFPKVYGKGASAVGISSKVYRQRKSHEQYSSYTEQVLGTEFNLLRRGRSDVGYEFLWRALSPSEDASRFIRKEVGHNVKSAIRFTYSFDSNQDNDGDSSESKNGVFLRSRLEVAGIGLDTQFLRHVKHEMDVFSRYRLAEFLRTTVTFGFNTGIIMPWSLQSVAFARESQSSSTCVSDRLFVGGASSSLRGFHLHGVGPMGQRRNEKGFDCLGGTVMTCCHAALTFDIFPMGRLPFKWMEGLRDLDVHGHVFMNGGNNIYLSTTANSGNVQSKPVDSSSTPYKYSSEGRLPTIHGNSGFMGDGSDLGGFRSVFRQFLKGFRLSCGVGIVVPTSMGEFELNYCHILRHQDTDRLRVGWQVNFNSSVNSL